MNDGSALEHIGSAIRKLRVSQGLTPEALATNAAVNYDTLLRVETGKRTLPEDTLMRIANILGFSSLHDMVAEGDTLPDFTAFSAAAAIIKVAKYKGLQIADLERRVQLSRGALENFILRNKTKTPASQAEFRAVETVFLVAKELGFESIAALYKQADLLPDDLANEIYQHPKIIQPMEEKELDGFKLPRVGAAINTLRISSGMNNKTLAYAATVSLNRLYALEAGTDDLSVDRVLAIAHVLGANSIAEMVSEAEQLPEITKSSVAKAIYSVARHKGIKLSELAAVSGVTFRNLECFVAARNQDENPYMALETTFPVAKALGFDSLGALVVGAAKLDTGIVSPEYQTPEFKNAVKALQWEKALTASDVAELCGIKTAAYEHMVSQRDGARIPIPVLEKLPSILGVPLLCEIIPTADALEPLPNKTLLGNAVRTLKQRAAMTREELAKSIGGTEGDVTDIMSATREVGIHKVRKLPMVFGCKTLRDIIDVATIDEAGIDRSNDKNFFAAARKLRISQGMDRGAMEREVGLKKYSLANFESGNGKAPKTEEALAVAKVLGCSKLSEVILQSAQLPDITVASVAKAILRMARSQGLEIEEIGKRAGFGESRLSNFIRHAQQPERARQGMALESAFLVAKQLGCTSLADMVNQAALLPDPELVDHERLENAVKILHLENGHLIKNLPTFQEQKHGRYPASTLRKLPAMYGVDSLQALIDKAEQLETVPDRVAFGMALQKWQYHTKMTNNDIMGLAGLTEYDVGNIRLPGTSPTAARKLRKIPMAFGCKSMQDMIEQSLNLPEIPSPLTTVKARNARIHETPEPEEEPAAEGHWVHLTQQRRIASRILGNAAAPRQDRS